MDAPEAPTHSFVVRIWLEETREETGRATWRGHITHVLGNERRYLEDLREIPRFIEPYLRAMGVDISFRRRACRRWCR